MVLPDSARLPASSPRRPSRMSAVAWVVCCVVAAPAHMSGVAHASAVFGPKEYLRTTGAPNTFTERFPVCRPDRSFELRVENGAGGRTRVSSASILVDGLEVVSQQELNEQVALIVQPVRLTAQTTLTVAVAGTPRGILTVALVSETDCLDLAFTAPGSGASVPAGLLTVRGVLGGFTEAGVTVNGFPAAVDSDGFVALVPVDPTVSELVAVATAPNGATVETRQPLSVTPAPEPVLVFDVAPASGVAPLTVTFGLSGPVAVTRIALDLEGGGVVDFEGASLEGSAFRYDTPGLYTPTVAVVDAQGQLHTATALVHVYDRAVLDVLLQSKWTALKASLRQGNLPGALASIAIRARRGYEELLNGLTIPLSQIDLALADIAFVSSEENRAEYQMIRMDNGVRVSYFVLFVKDADGIWRLKFF